ncbi:carbohydrate binding family 9 domain-containing protein [candidate division WOR-3 bacterium]|nr:carbohydrate binding family 9 domain-containing protein [candidate division WOR-3 bacterium]MCK4527477.1 carbohydrate binding family 9 domain-containing protein [candidate division WOR-3 bacterium]
MLLLLISLQITITEKVPVIDGRLESLWESAEPISGFTQSEPEAGESATESTLVYLLTDKDNLYIGFRCFSKDVEPKIEISGWDEARGDKVFLYLDTFGDKRKCYFFAVSAAGTQGDAIISMGGRSWDFSYDGIWEAATQVGSNEWVAEMKIPFKAIRYNKGEWGLQLCRWIGRKRENAYWIEVEEMKGLQIKDFEPISGISPETKGRFLEFYPVGAIRHDTEWGTISGIDLSWDPSSNTSIDVTINPDYAQIEADPFRVNLSQYALYLSEKRPFFLKGREMFNMQRGGSFNIGSGPFTFFYSRNIGRIVDDTLQIPIRLGAKVTTRGNGMEFAGLFANTGGAGESEQAANYLIGRFVKQTPFGLDAGFSYLAKYTDGSNVQLIGLDGAADFGDNQVVYQIALADSSKVSDLAEYFEWKRITRDFMAAVNIRNVGEEFNANEIGYITSKGINVASAICPIFYPDKGPIRHIGFGFGGGGGKQPWIEDYGYGIFCFSWTNLRNGWNLNGNANIGKSYEDTSCSMEPGSDIEFISRGLSFNINSSYSGMFGFSLWNYIGYNFNWFAEHLGYQARGGVYLMFKPSQRFYIGGSIDFIGYWEEETAFSELFSTKKLEDMYVIASPEMTYHFSPLLEAELKTEFTYQWSEGELIQVRINPLIRWMVSPKSWFYLVYSKSVESDERFFDVPGASIIKLRYLIYL